MATLQEYLNSQYPIKEAKEKLKEITTDLWGLEIINQNGESHTLTKEEVKELDGKELNLSEYSNLEKVDIWGSWLKSKLTSLDVSNCSKLIELKCSSNQITNLNIQGCAKLQNLDYQHNPLFANNDFANSLNFASYPFLKKDILLNWTDIHKDFAIIMRYHNDYDDYDDYDNKTYQQLWEEKDLTYQDAQEWIQAGWNSWEFIVISFWKSQGYTPETAKGKSHAQEYLDKWYPKEGKCKLENNKVLWQEYANQNYGKERKDIIKLDINHQNLTNSLDLTDFINLEVLVCSYNSLTNLTINNCPELKDIYCPNNQLTNLNISNQLELTYLDCSWNNSLTNLIVTNNSQLICLVASDCNLINLELINNPQLKTLNCYNNRNLTFDLADLPESLEAFACSETKLAKELEIYGKPNYNNHLNLLQEWRDYPKWQERGFSEPEIKQWISIGLSYQEYEKANFLKEQKVTSNQLQEELKSFNGDYQLWKADYLLKQLEVEKAKIPTFEKEILRLTNLIKSYKEKIIEAYTHFFNEKELLKELITAHLEFSKAKQEKQPAYKLEKERDRIKAKLESKFSEETVEENMEKVITILHNCEELIHYETELQAQINQNQKLISNHQQVIQQITYQIGSININKGHGFIGNQTIEEVLETKINNTQVGNVNFDNTQIEGSVAIGVGQITEQQAQIQLPPKSNQS